MNRLATVALVAATSLSAFGCARPGAMPCAHGGVVASVDGPAPITVRAEAGSLWTSRHRWSEPHRAAPLPSRGAVDDLRVEPMADGRWEVRFRQGGAAWRAEVGASRDERSRVVADAAAARPEVVAAE